MEHLVVLQLFVSNECIEDGLLFNSSLSSFASCSLALRSVEVMPVVIHSMSIVPVVGSVADCCKATCIQRHRLPSHCKLVAIDEHDIDVCVATTLLAHHSANRALHTIRVTRLHCCTPCCNRAYSNRSLPMLCSICTLVHEGTPHATLMTEFFRMQH